MHSVFRSTHHPGETPRGLAYARALAGPIGACTTPVMIGATAAALQGHLVWGYLVWGLPAALLTASVWTHFALATTPAELHLKSGQCAVRSVHDVLHDVPPEYHPLYDVRETRWETELALGWDTQTCSRTDWPRYRELRRTAQQALSSSSVSTGRSSTASCG